jgi:hypothetical protein
MSRYVSFGAFGEPAQTFGCIPRGVNQGGDVQNFVPDGEVWVIEAAGVGQTGSGGYSGLTLALHVECLLDPPALGVHLFPITGMQTIAGSTPFLALPRPVLLMPRMRLGVRFSGPPQGLQVSLMGYGFAHPIADLDRLLLRGGVTTVTSPAPDMTQLLEKARTAAAALQAFAQSVP